MPKSLAPPGSARYCLERIVAEFTVFGVDTRYFDDATLASEAQKLIARDRIPTARSSAHLAKLEPLQEDA